MKICLIGFMGAGKTTLGKKLAASLNFDFIDLDDYIEEKHKNAISAIFQLLGEDGFRKIERDCLMEVVNGTNMVLSTGGGTPCFFDNMDIINNNCVSFYLKLPSKFLADRLIIAKKKRPLIQNKSLSELDEFIETTLVKREPYYNKAHFIITDTNPQVNDIINLLTD